MRVRCGAICLIALFATLSIQERSASKQLAPQFPMWGDLFNRPVRGFVYSGDKRE
jgi:hypothetical protein